MTKFLLSAAGVAALAAAAPAAAQYYPAPYGGYNQPVPYGYGQPQGYGYGYNYGSQDGLIRSYLIRADQLRRQIERSDSRDRISEREAARLRAAAIDLQNRTRAYAQGGLSWRERRDLDLRFDGLRRALYRDARDGRWGNDWDRRGEWRDRDRDGRWDARDGWVDRDRDGRDDRWERRHRDRDDDDRD